MNKKNIIFAAALKRGVAQLVAHLYGVQVVVGSSPITPTETQLITSCVFNYPCNNIMPVFRFFYDGRFGKDVSFVLAFDYCQIFAAL